MVRESKYEAVYEVANQWRDRCLADDKSLLWPNEVTWTMGNIETLYGKLYGKQAHESEDFFVRTTARIEDEQASVHRLFADLTAVWSLMPGAYKPETKYGWTSGIWNHWGLEQPENAPLLRSAYETKVASNEGSSGSHALRRSAQMQFFWSSRNG